jgi:L-alanine-DL-glutamate epimerase-like enolase superfamily enzyme
MRIESIESIESIAVYTADLTYTGKAYAFAGGRSHQVFTSTVVVTTDTGLHGYGEVCPCGPDRACGCQGGH